MDSTIPARFAAIVDLLCRILQGRFGPRRYAIHMTDAQRGLVHNRIRAIGRQFAAVIARRAAGTLRRPAIRAPRAARPAADPATLRKPPLRWPDGLRQDHGWLQRLVQPATWASSALYTLFRDPEMQALLAELPQLRRILRPICTMLDVERPPPQPSAPQPSAPQPSARKSRRRRRSRWPFFPNPPAIPIVKIAKNG